MKDKIRNNKNVLSAAAEKNVGVRFLVIVGSFAIVFSAFVLFRTWSSGNSHINQLLSNQAELALSFDLAIREYVAEMVRPFAQEHVDPNDFIPEVMSSSFTARNIFEKGRKAFPDCIIKFSSENPRNPDNLAAKEEIQIIKFFNENPQVSSWSGQIEINDREYQANFSPRRLEQRCLRCHGKPEDAPSSMLALYGDKGGFHRQVGDVIALDSITIPTGKYRYNANIEAVTNAFILISGLICLLAAIYWAFHRLVSRRLAAISKHFRNALVQEQNVIKLIEDHGNDEIGLLAQNFNFLAGKLQNLYESLEHRVEERTARLEQANKKLEKEISERQKTEDNLRESRQRYKDLTETLPQTIFETDEKGRLIFVNETAFKAFGYTREDFEKGLTTLDMIAAEEHQRAVENIKKVLCGKDIGGSEYTAVRKDGTRFSVLINSRRVILQGKPVGLRGIITDITEIKRAEKKLRDSEKRLRAKLEFITSPEKDSEDLSLLNLIELKDLQKIQDSFACATGVASVITDVKGNPITKPSNFCGVCQMIRETEKGKQQCMLSDKILGEKAKKLMKPTYQECLSCGFIDASAPLLVAGRHLGNWLIGQSNPMNVDKNRIVQYAEEIGADVETMILSFEAMPQMSLERFNSVLDHLWYLARKISTLAYNNLLLSRDINELKQAEEALKMAKEQAEKSNIETEQINRQLQVSIERSNILACQALAADRAKSEFLANMSHEIRTPMNAILGFSDILSESELTKEQKNYINIICESGQNLLRIIDDILDFSKIEAGKIETEVTQCSLTHLIGSVESLMRPEAARKGLEFEIIQNGPIPAEIRTDPTRLRQCLINLVSNAVKFTETGYVHLKIAIEDMNNKAHIRFDIEDTGIGIPQDKQDVIFESFVQADGATTRKYGGTGLGLAITYQLANLLGGKLNVRSEDGKGSVFTLTLPLGFEMGHQTIKENFKTDDKHTKPDTEKMETLYGNILVAEDSKTNQILIKLLLEKMGFDVTVAEDGKEAFDIILNNRDKFSLILMDIQMPNMNGYETARLIRKDGINIPIIALTAHAMKGDKEKCIEAGCNDYLTKPIDKKKLVNTIRKHLIMEDKKLLNKINSLKTQMDELAEFCTGQPKAENNPRINIEADEPLIDWVSAMETCGSEEVLMAIAEAFMRDGPKTIEMTVQAISKNDMEAVADSAHRLKGAAAAINAMKLKHAAYSLEKAGKENNSDAAKSAFEQVRYEYERLIALLSKPDWAQKAKQNC